MSKTLNLSRIARGPKSKKKQFWLLERHPIVSYGPGFIDVDFGTGTKDYGSDFTVRIERADLLHAYDAIGEAIKSRITTWGQSL